MTISPYFRQVSAIEDKISDSRKIVENLVDWRRRQLLYIIRRAMFTHFGMQNVLQFLDIRAAYI